MLMVKTQLKRRGGKGQKDMAVQSRRRRMHYVYFSAEPFATHTAIIAHD